MPLLLLRNYGPFDISDQLATPKRLWFPEPPTKTNRSPLSVGYTVDGFGHVARTETHGLSLDEVSLATAPDLTLDVGVQSMTTVQETGENIYITVATIVKTG